MVDALGDDGMELYRMMGKKAGVMEGHSTNTNEDVSNKMKTAKLKELERKLKSWDYKYVHTTKSNGYKKGVAQEQEIIKLYKELGAEGLEMYRSFLKSKGMKEAKKDPIPSEYEIHLNKVMKSWGITSPDQLKDDESGNEALKRFWQEVDDTFEGSNEVQVNLPESIFPEMNTVQRQGTLGYGDDRKVGEQSLTASTFCDAGNLYENHPTWQPPSPQRKRGWQDK